MPEYEVMFIIQEDLVDTAYSDVIERVSDWIKDGAGKVIKVNHWGKKQFAQPIKKQTIGQYVLIDAEIPAPLVSELEKNIQLHEQILRSLIIRKTQ